MRILESSDASKKYLTLKDDEVDMIIAARAVFQLAQLLCDSLFIIMLGLSQRMEDINKFN